MKEERKQKDWWLQDKIDAIWWGVVLLWGALVLLAEATGFVEDYRLVGWLGCILHWSWWYYVIRDNHPLTNANLTCPPNWSSFDVRPKDKKEPF